ncbi:hypothetical protein [Mycobacteroides abscessus]|uniref:hypothetical protein n=1 Tax=Mycobacteroides abscessus TaxID=36809 RepID=UPI0005DA8BEB|nr:hypothetical protein [Mycobacteroides abscessus]CPS10250.1 Uncharacterised protein [Mycobacteroides abscessus]CPU99377.1 Uncharacterised protein [Mycobacteroides abscessus]
MGIEVQKARGNEIIYRSPNGPIHIKAWDDNAGTWYLALNAPDRHPDGSRKQTTRTLLIGPQHHADIEAFVQAFAAIYEAANKPKASRKLGGLDCDEARDGTVWADSDEGFPFHYRFRGGHWEYLALAGERSWRVLDDPYSLIGYGPYVEVTA